MGHKKSNITFDLDKIKKRLYEMRNEKSLKSRPYYDIYGNVIRKGIHSQ